MSAMSKPLTSEWLLARLLTTLGLGSAALAPAPGCAGRSEPPSNSMAQSVPSSTPDARSCRAQGERLTQPPDGCQGEQRGSTYACLPTPPKGRPCSQTYSKRCVLEAAQCSQEESDVVCGPVTGPKGTCCYVINSLFCADFYSTVRRRLESRPATVGEDPSCACDL